MFDFTLYRIFNHEMVIEAKLYLLPRHKASKIKLARVRGNNASPLVFMVPSFNWSALSLKTFNSAGPRGIFFNRPSNSVS